MFSRPSGTAIPCGPFPARKLAGYYHGVPPEHLVRTDPGDRAYALG